MTPQQLKAMKLALEALEFYYDMHEEEADAKAITAIKETLAEHAMREVQRLGQEIEKKIGCVNHDCDQCKAQPESWEKLCDSNCVWTDHHPDCKLAQTEREWVELTDEDKNDCLVEADPCECLATPEAQELMRCVAAKLRSKNT